jgi:predicted Zn finger-like uncharacterized protein
LLIRCDRCSTLYELDEALLAPEGSPVQCTRCNHVFTARPAAGTSGDAPPPPPPARSEPPPEAAVEEVPEPPPASVSRQSAPPQRERSGPPVYRPSVAPSAPTVTRPPQIRRDAVGAFEARLRRSARWRWLAPTLVVLALAALAAAWLLFSRRHGPVAERLRTEGLALVALDDSASLRQGIALFDEALRSAPNRREAEADRALAEVLQATALLEAGEEMAARAAAQIGAGAEPPAGANPGPQQTGAASPADRAVPAAPAPEVARLQAEARDRTARGTELSRSAREALQRLEAERVAAPEVVRALAMQHAAAGEREEVARYVGAGRVNAPDDPWLALAEATLDARARDRAARERGAAALSALSKRQPEMLRARYLLSLAQAGLGRRAEAQATVDGILAANPRHERAEALRAELARPVPAPAASPAAVRAGTAPGNGGSPERNAASQRVAPPALAAPSGATPPGGAAPVRGPTPVTAPATAPRAGRTGAGAPAHYPSPSGAAPAGRVSAPSGVAAPPAGSTVPEEAAPVIAPRPRARPAPEARPVEYGGGQ